MEAAKEARSKRTDAGVERHERCLMMVELGVEGSCR